MDLLDFFRGVYPWGKLHRLIGQLPWWSKYKLLIADDDEYAEQARAVAGRDGSRPTRPKLTEWDPNRELAAEMRDGFARLEAAIANTAANRKKGSQPVKPKPTLRPLTAAQRAEKRADYQVHLDIVKQVLPGR
jgi:hypothetical protein